MEPQMAAGAAGTARIPRVAAPRRASRRPSTLQMIKEALQAQGEKGASVVTIKQFILAKYPLENPIRLKYLLKQALSKGLRCGELVRPPNSSAVGASGTFMLAPKKPQHKQQLGQANPDRGQARKPGQKGTTKAPRAPEAGTQQRDAVKKQPAAGKQKAKPVDAELQAAAAGKPRSNEAKPLRAANPPRAPKKGPSGPPRDADPSQAPKKGPSGPPRAANHSRAPGTGRSRPPQAADHTQKGPHPGKGSSVAAQDAGGGESSAGARAKGPQKASGGKKKGKVPRGAQQDVPKAQGDQGQARKPRVTPGARQGEAKKAAPSAEERKAS